MTICLVTEGPFKLTTSKYHILSQVMLSTLRVDFNERNLWILEPLGFGHVVPIDQITSFGPNSKQGTEYHFEIKTGSITVGLTFEKLSDYEDCSRAIAYVKSLPMA